LARAGDDIPVLACIAHLVHGTDALTKIWIEDQWQAVETNASANLEITFTLASVINVDKRTICCFLALNCFTEARLSGSIPESVHRACSSASFAGVGRSVPVSVGTAVDREGLAPTAGNVVKLAMVCACGLVFFAIVVDFVVELVFAATQRLLQALAGLSAEEFVAWAVKVLLAFAQAVGGVPVELGDRSHQIDIWASLNLAAARARLSVEVKAGRAFVVLISAFALPSPVVEHLEIVANHWDISAIARHAIEVFSRDACQGNEFAGASLGVPRLQRSTRLRSWNAGASALVSVPVVIWVRALLVLVTSALA